MPEPAVPPQNVELEKLIRDALTYYYDFAYLQSHALAALLVGSPLATSQTRAKELRRILLEAIEELNPGDAVAVRAPVRRPYAILMGLYVEGQAQPEVSSALGISGRQLRRDRSAAIQALASIIRDRYLAEPAYTQRSEELLHNESTWLAQERELVDISDVVDELTHLLQGLADEHGFALSAFVQPRIPRPRTNRVLLRQALISLATHLATEFPLKQLIFEASPRDSYAIVGIRARWLGSSEARADLCRLDLQSTETIVQALGGEVERSTDTQPNTEITISVLLPIEREATVLVVDDNESLFALFQRYTVGHPYRLVHASSVEQALSALEVHQPQVITVDLMMPKYDGWELLRHLKDNPNVGAAAVVVCSVLDEPELARIQGADLYLKKPVNQTDLLQLLSQAGALARQRADHPEYLERSAEEREPEDR